MHRLRAFAARHADRLAFLIILAGVLALVSPRWVSAQLNRVSVNQIVGTSTWTPNIGAIGLGHAAGTTGQLTFQNGTVLADSALGTLAMVSSATTNNVRLPNGSNLEYGFCGWVSNAWVCGNAANGGTSRATNITAAGAINFAPNGGGNVMQISTGGNFLWSTDKGGDIGTATTTRPNFVHIGGPAITAPTDSTVVEGGDVVDLRSSSTITPATAGVGNCGAAFLAAALTADCVVGTIPAGMQLVGAYADVTVGFACSGTCSGTKVFQCGTATNGTQIFAASLSVAATGQFGLADANMGTGMTRAAAIQGGLIGSWTATTPISCRFTSGTGNWGSGAATFVNAGSIKFIFITRQIK